jgi:predicted aspartyl protease
MSFHALTVASVLSLCLARASIADPTDPTPPADASTPAPAQAQVTAPDGTTVATPAAETDEPLYVAPTHLDRIGRILAPVKINGQGPFRFMVDTGASHSAIALRVAQSLHLTAGSSASMTLNGVTGTASVPAVQVDRLQAGDVVLEHRQLPVLEYVLANADGILGVEGFEDKRILVDFERDLITISRSRSQRPAFGFSVVPVKLRFGRLLVIDVAVGGIRAKGVIDTGSEATLGNSALARELGLRVNPKKPPTEVFGATPDLQHGASVTIPQISLGEMHITNASVTFGDLYVFKLWELERQPAMLIGMDVLGKLGTLVIDYRRRELQIKLPRAR